MSARASPPILAVLLLATKAATAEMPADPLAPLLACRALAEAEARLACFDRESAELSKSGAPAASATSHASVAPAVRSPIAPQEAFGLPPMEVAKREAAEAQRQELTESEGRLARLGYLSDGRVEFFFENGQVWRQLTVTDDLLLKSGDVVTISRRALRSYWLKGPSGRGCKVTRIK